MNDLEDKSDQEKNVLLVLLYFGMLAEAGLIENTDKLTLSGFELAMQLKESGRKLTSDEIMESCMILDIPNPQTFIPLLYDVQNMGSAKLLAKKINEFS